MKTQLVQAMCCAGLLVAFQGTALAQSGPKWELDVHVGGYAVNDPVDGTASLPPAGASFPTPAGRPSRQVSSWYLGDGTRLFNDVMSGFPANLSQRITPLDGVVDSRLASRENGIAFGARLSRAITSRFSAELTVDYSPAELRMTSESQSGIDSSGRSFESGFRALLGTAPASGLVVSSRSTFDEGNGGQLLTTGAVNVALRTKGAVIPYVTGGAGVVSALGDAPSARLDGNYRFQLGGIFPINESDAVSVRVSAPDHVFVGVVGGGVRYLASPRWGIRADARAYLGRNEVDTIIEATPSVPSGTPANPFPLSSSTSPAIQFSNNPAVGQSSLSGPAVQDFRAFEGSGTVRHVAVTAGLFLRF